MEINNEDIQKATAFYLEMVKAYNKYPSNENMSAQYGAGEVLKEIGIDIRGIGEKYHCPVCGHYYGRNFIVYGNDPDCAKCGWEGKY